MALDSKALQTIIDDVLSTTDTANLPDNNSSMSFNMKVYFYNSADTSWSMTITNAESLVIKQRADELGEYGDNIILEFQVTPKDYIELTRNYRNLCAKITLNWYDLITKTKDTTKKAIEKDYRVFITRKVDLLSMESYRKLVYSSKDAELSNQVELPQHSNTILPLELQLIDKPLYDIRKKLVNTVLKNVNLTTAIRYIAGKLGVQRINMYKADNDLVYPMIIIDPDNAHFDRVFSYLQEKYGVYKAGLTYFFTNDTLYIYPAYGMDAIKDKIIQIVNVESGRYSGTDKPYKFKDKDANKNIYTKMYLLNTENANPISMNESSSENTATIFSVSRADRAFDMADSTDPTNITIPKDNVCILGSEDDGMMDDTAIRMSHIKPTNNIYRLTTMLIAKSNEIYTIKIPSIVLFTQEVRYPHPIIVGQMCIINYDTDEGVKTKKGIITAVSYNCFRARDLGGDIGYVYTASAEIMITAISSSKDYSNKTLQNQ
jgi:hypothetical protein